MNRAGCANDEAWRGLLPATRGCAGAARRNSLAFPGAPGAHPVLAGGAAKQQMAALCSADRAQFHHPVGELERLPVVADHDDGAADRHQVAELPVQEFFFKRMEPRARFIEDVQHAADGVFQEIGDLDALPFAAGKGGYGALQGQMPQAEALQEPGVRRQALTK